MSARSEPTPDLINFSWLLKLRWVAGMGQILALISAGAILGLRPATGPMLLLVGATLGSNVALTWWLRRQQAVQVWAPGSVMALDVLLLTALLHFAGGPANPFASLYFVHIALGAVILPPRWTGGLVALSLATFGLLFVVPAPAGSPEVAARIEGVMATRWLASALTALVIAYFVIRVQSALAQREQELAKARERQARSEKLASLATLSAGAAHELSTPLSTIAVIAKELERAMQRRQEAELIDDARLIREQVDRCRGILEQMAAEAGHSLGDLISAVPVGALLDLSIQPLELRNRVEVQGAAPVMGRTVNVPPKVLAQALRGIIKNALDASPDGAVVRVSVEEEEERWAVIRVRDSGKGIPADVLARIGEPFFTTKEPGRGMGLGVFLARAVVERIGGDLQLESATNQGTTASIRVPIEVGR